MASASEFLQDLAKKPPAHKAAILCGVLGFVGFVYWQFVYSDLQTSKQKAESTKSRLRTKRTGLDAKLLTYMKDKCRTGNEPVQKCNQEKLPYGDLKGVGDDALRALPSSPEWGTFIQILQKKAGDATVHITALDTKKEEPAGEYIKVPAFITIKGAFHDIMKFFYLLRPARPKGISGASAASPKTGSATLTKVDRIVNIENLSLVVAGNDTSDLKATFLASTFYRKEIPKPKVVAPKPGAKASGTMKAPSGAQVLKGGGVPK